jgi:hypothetical protein
MDHSLTIVIKNFRNVPYDKENLVSWFNPGSVIFINDLLVANCDLQRLFQMPFAAVCMCLRDQEYKTFDVSFLRYFSDDYSLVDILFSPWLKQLQPTLCDFCGLNADTLIEAGLTKRHVRQLFLPLSFWAETLSFEQKHWRKLRITRNAHNYFCDLDNELLNGVSALHLDL